MNHMIKIIMPTKLGATILNDFESSQNVFFMLGVQCVYLIAVKSLCGLTID